MTYCKNKECMISRYRMTIVQSQTELTTLWSYVQISFRQAVSTITNCVAEYRIVFFCQISQHKITYISHFHAQCLGKSVFCSHRNCNHALEHNTNNSTPTKKINQSHNLKLRYYFYIAETNKWTTSFRLLLFLLECRILVVTKSSKQIHYYNTGIPKTQSKQNITGLTRNGNTNQQCVNIHTLSC
jgi:hypothetical protein